MGERFGLESKEESDVVVLERRAPRRWSRERILSLSLSLSRISFSFLFALRLYLFLFSASTRAA